jgi:hypothetical protein
MTWRAPAISAGPYQLGMSVARFNFSLGSHEYHQGTLDTLRQAMQNRQLTCAVLLDTKGPEIRTGMLKGGKPAGPDMRPDLLLIGSHCLFPAGLDRYTMWWMTLCAPARYVVELWCG